ncbi:LamG-like jellyroll fold domain-containing protein [Pedosphaera parvula]|uniref:Coagulation factor 5/8 type domain protein n=1 Tax=Pedosphaera parvula (strain Ellin514) TaxID=320771 RepID=B9XF62_PEDPL|nr:LamG-like jellyroll fold domain-containing protein [Pedosphaera parvula]EEF61560.1 coagulation factor 5/8 type domain protein [Pedosphaera parvula Ellin514]
MFRKLVPFVACGAVLAGLISPSTSRAANIQGVTINSVSSEYLSGVEQRRATNMLNNTGLYGDILTTVPGGAMWVSFTNTAAALTNEYVTFDLGAVHPIDQMKVWPYNEGANLTTPKQGLRSADILTSFDGVNYTTNFPNYAFNLAPGTFVSTVQSIPFNGLQARYVRLNVHTNWGNTFRVGIGKVRFVDTNVPPTLNSASYSFAGNRVTVRFSESVLPSTATNIANYSIQSGATTATIQSATMDIYNDGVVLQTSPLNTNLSYTLTASNVRDAANTISIVNNSQVTLGAELIAWLKADVGVLTDGGGNVTQWNDQSGLGNNALVATNGAAPFLSTGVVNGNPAVHFDGISQVLEISNNPSLYSDRDFTIYLLLSVDSLGVVHGPISKAQTNIPASFDFQIAKTSGRLNFVRGNGSGYNSFSPTAGALSAGQYYLLSIVMRGTNALMYQNGNFFANAAYTAGFGDAGSAVRIGMRQDLGTKFQGNLAEVMLFRGAVSDSEKTAIDNYLGSKYGISIIPLAITQQPSNVTQQEGKTASFWVDAIAGSPTILYQWQKNGLNISGATNASYTTPILVQSDSGATFRAIVSTPLGISTNSSTVTLTVTADTQAPTIFSATRQSGSSNTIMVVYSEDVAPLAATNAANYTLDNGVTVSSVAVGSAANQVILNTSALDNSTIYTLGVQNVKDLFNQTISPASTLVMPANMALWLRADSGVVSDSSGNVTEWNDQSPNRNNATQYLGANYYPVLVPGAMNGQPVVRFGVGATNFMQVASSSSVAITSDMTIYAVVNIPDLSVPCEIIGKTAVQYPAPYDYYVQTTTLTRFYRGNGTSGYALVNGTPPSLGVPHVLAVRMAGSSVTHYVDGVSAGTGTIVTNIADTGAPLRIGGRSDLAQTMHGDMSEILLFRSGLSATERRAVDSYLSLKYFPFIFTQQPQSVSKLEGETATFTVGASQGAASLSYQWQRNSVNIPGATNFSYTTPLLVQADSGSTFRVLITPLGGTTATSDTATLTVSPDNQAPTVVSIGKAFWNQNQIIVVFSESVDPSMATNSSNYVLDNGATVTGAAIGTAPNLIVLSTSGLNASTTYSVTVQNVRDLYNNTISTSNTPVGYYPASLGLWLKADAGLTVDAQNYVSSWADQSGYGNTASFYDPTAYPLFVPSANDGLPAVNFNGTNQYLAVNPSPSLTITGDLSIYVVARIKDFTSTTNEVGLVEKTDGNLAAPFDYYLAKTTGLPWFYRGAGQGQPYGSVTGTKAPPINSTHILSVVMNGNQATHYLDGLTNGTGTITQVGGDNPTKVIGIGTRDGFQPKMNGDFKEILLFTSAVSDADRAAIDSYLTSKYGILVGPVPKITLAATGGGSIVLSWPTPNLNFTLQSAADLSGSAWTTAPDAVTSSNGVSSVNISVTAAQKFYRLHKQ